LGKHPAAGVARSIGLKRKGVTMSRMSTSHIAVLLAVGSIVPMQLLNPRPGLAETLGNGAANGFAAIAISDSAAGFATTAAVGGIAIGPDAHAFTQDATHPCMGTPTTNCGQGNIAIGTSSEASNDFAAAVGFLAHAGGLNGSAFGANTVARGQNSSAFGNGANAVGDGSAAYGFNSKASGFDSSAFGGLANASGSSSVATGTSATANGSVSVAIGFVPTAEDTATIALGDHARAGVVNAIAIGTTSKAGNRVAGSPSAGNRHRHRQQCIDLESCDQGRRG
jgi:hypothetical protein